MQLPWGLLADNPTLGATVAVLLPFAWLLWQVYAVRLPWVERTKWTQTKDEIKSEVRRVEGRVDDIDHKLDELCDTQQKLTNITVAQARMLNGYDGEMDMEEVESDLGDEDEKTASDYLE